VAQFIIQHASHMRVCVHTANLIESDWKYKTQGAYVQDFPLKTDPAAAASVFEQEVRRHLQSRRCGAYVGTVLRCFSKQRSCATENSSFGRNGSKRISNVQYN